MLGENVCRKFVHRDMQKEKSWYGSKEKKQFLATCDESRTDKCKLSRYVGLISITKITATTQLHLTYTNTHREIPPVKTHSHLQNKWQKLRGTHVPSKHCHSVLQKWVIFPICSKLTWPCLDCSYNNDKIQNNTWIYHNFYTSTGLLICQADILCISFMQTSVCSISLPLPRRETLFTKSTETEHERREQDLDAISDSAQTLERQTCFIPPPTRLLVPWMGCTLETLKHRFCLSEHVTHMS